MEGSAIRIPSKGIQAACAKLVGVIDVSKCLRRPWHDKAGWSLCCCPIESFWHAVLASVQGDRSMPPSLRGAEGVLEFAADLLACAKGEVPCWRECALAASNSGRQMQKMVAKHNSQLPKVQVLHKCDINSSSVCLCTQAQGTSGAVVPHTAQRCGHGRLPRRGRSQSAAFGCARLRRSPSAQVRQLQPCPCTV
jgi:hypothetical protein